MWNATTTPTTVTVNSKELLKFMVEQYKANGDKPASWRTAAFHFMPVGVKWFESGEDYSFAFWLEAVAKEARRRGRHVKGTYAFKDKGCNC